MDSLSRDQAAIEALSRLLTNPSFKILQQEVKAARETYFANLARVLARSTQPINQREIDEKRGFFAGALWAVTTFPKLADKDLQRQVEESLKEAE